MSTAHVHGLTVEDTAILFRRVGYPALLASMHEHASQDDYRAFRALMGRRGYQGHLGGGYDEDENANVGAAARSWRRWTMAFWAEPYDPQFFLAD
jgi:hypothetical protein